MPREYRSATEYLFGEEQTDAIVRTVAYDCEHYRRAVIWFSPWVHLYVRPLIATPFQRTSNIGLGSLDRLPLELVLKMIFRLDMHSLLRFRQVNLRLRQMVDSLKQYQMIVSHGLNALYALLRTRLAIDISLLDFSNALCIKACSFCGEFGGFITLLTWERCCFRCLKEAPETQLRSLAAIRKNFGLTQAELDQLKSFNALPGLYSMKESVDGSHIAIASSHQASLICRRQSHALGRAPSTSSEGDQKFNLMGACALPYYDKLTGDVEHGMLCAGCQRAIHMDIIDNGDATRAPEGDKVYARDGFLEHFRWCKQAQQLWRSSGQGEDRLTELRRLLAPFLDS